MRVKGWTKTPDFDPNSQDPDSPNDPTVRREGGILVTGRGSVSGGSKMTPQIKLMTTGNSRGGSYKIGNTAPKQTQKIRG